jgi:hypothetical protein
MGAEDASLAADGILVDMAAVKARKAFEPAAAADPVEPAASLRSDCVTDDFNEENAVRSGDEWMVAALLDLKDPIETPVGF